MQGLLPLQRPSQGSGRLRRARTHGQPGVYLNDDSSCYLWHHHPSRAHRNHCQWTGHPHCIFHLPTHVGDSWLPPRGMTELRGCVRVLFQRQLRRCLLSTVLMQLWTTTMFDLNVVGVANTTSAGWGNLGGGVAQMLNTAIFKLCKVSGMTNNDQAGCRATCAWSPAVIFCLGVAVFFFNLFSDDCPHGNFRTSDVVVTVCVCENASTNSQTAPLEEFSIHVRMDLALRHHLAWCVCM